MIRGRPHLNNSRRPAAPLLLLIISAITMQPCLAQDAPALNSDDFRVSFIYAAVMGTGTYEIDDRRITMLQVPFKLSQREMTEEQTGITWLAPVSVGYDAVTDNDWLSRIFEEDLVTLSVMPGFELQIPLNQTWTIKPLGNLGASRDFTNEETIIMGVLGLRALGTWGSTDGWEFRWGTGARLASEYQLKSHDTLAFTILETGVDYRRDTGFQVLQRKVNAGIYYRLQVFVPTWGITATPYGDSEIRDINEVGFSVGLKKPRKFFGVSFERVRVGYQRGDHFSGWTVGSQFPF